MNSVKTCMDPWTASRELEDMRWIRESRRSGYSSGQSQLAIDDSVWA